MKPEDPEKDIDNKNRDEKIYISGVGVGEEGRKTI